MCELAAKLEVERLDIDRPQSELPVVCSKSHLHKMPLLSGLSENVFRRLVQTS